MHLSDMRGTRRIWRKVSISIANIRAREGEADRPPSSRPRREVIYGSCRNAIELMTLHRDDRDGSREEFETSDQKSPRVSFRAHRGQIGRAGKGLHRM